MRGFTILAECIFLALLVWIDLRHGWPWQQTISDQVHGPAGPWLAVAFVVHALSLTALAVCRRHVRWPLAVAALGMLLVAFFPTDLPGADTRVGDLHILGAAVAFAGVAWAAWCCRRDMPVVPLSLAVPFMTLIFWGAIGLSLWVGALERVQVALNGAWIILAAASAPRFSRTPKSPAT